VLKTAAYVQLQQLNASYSSASRAVHAFDDDDDSVRQTASSTQPTPLHPLSSPTTLNVDLLDRNHSHFRVRQGDER